MDTCSDDQTAKLWNVTDSDNISLLYTTTLNNTFSSNQCSAFSHDGTKLAIKAGFKVRIFDTKTGAMLHDIDAEDHCAYLGRSLEFSPDDKLLAANYGHIWDVETGTVYKDLYEIAKISAIIGSSVYTTKFSANGTYIVATYDYGKVRIIPTTHEIISKKLWNLSHEKLEFINNLFELNKDVRENFKKRKFYGQRQKITFTEEQTQLWRSLPQFTRTCLISNLESLHLGSAAPSSSAATSLATASASAIPAIKKHR